MVLGRSWFPRVCTFCPRNVSLNAVQEIVRTHKNFDFSTPPFPLHAPCLLNTSECPLNPKHVTGDLQTFYCAKKWTKVLYLHVISTFIHKICMGKDCHIFSKHLVFQFRNLVFQTKHLVFRPEILAFDRNTSSLKLTILKY